MLKRHLGMLILAVGMTLPATQIFEDSQAIYHNAFDGVERVQGGRNMEYECFTGQTVQATAIFPYEHEAEIQWATSDIPGGKGGIIIDIPIGMGTGWLRPNMKADYELYVDGRKVVTFNCTNKEKDFWQGVDGVSLTYYSLHSDAVGELHGRACLYLPPRFPRPETFFTIKIKTTPQSSGNAWVMFHLQAPITGNDIPYWIRLSNIKYKTKELKELKK